MNIPVFRPSLPSAEELQPLMQQIMENKWVTNFGPMCQKFENIAREYLGNPNVMAVSNCDTGLILAIKALNLPKGSKVILPSFTFTSTVNAVIWNDLIPVLVDIDIATFNIDPIQVATALERDTSIGLIIGTHIFGNPCEIGLLENLAEDFDVHLIFDAAHAYGSKYYGKPIGSPSYRTDAQVFSFSGTKLVTSGEGGLIVYRTSWYDGLGTEDCEVVKEKIELLRGYGFKGDYNCKITGMNGKLSEFNAAVGTLTLPTIDDMVVRRNQIVAKYNELFTKYGLRFNQQLVYKQNTSTYKDFAIVFNTKLERDKVEARLATNGIQTKKYFLPLHMTDRYKDVQRFGYLTRTKMIADRILCLPIFNEITDEEIEYVVQKIKEVV